MRTWLLTSTTYGTWLPGDERGSVTSVRDERKYDRPSETRFEHNRPGEAWEPAIPELKQSAREQMRGKPVYLNQEQAEVVVAQFNETATFRNRELLAAAVMSNHFHLVVQVADDPDPRQMLTDFKAYASRALNQQFGELPLGRWWTKAGSVRKLVDEIAIAAAVNYVLHKQPNPLAVWPHGEPRTSVTGDPADDDT